MEVLFYLSSLCLLLFMVLATYDGAYLHLWKFELFNKQESKFEHKTHTIRAVLFPLIVWFLFVNGSNFNSFLIGLSLVFIDLIILAIDAYSEKDSRQFMGGLPKWEYIIHLFSNTFHFAAIILILAARFTIVDESVMFINTIPESLGKQVFDVIAVNMIPGGIVLALIHVILIFPIGKSLWNNQRTKITCC